MASGEGSSWWGSLLNSNFVKAAKEKSINALEIMKTDLAEFTSTMSSDTTNLLNQATAQLKEISSHNLNFEDDGKIDDDVKSKKNNYNNKTNKKSSPITSNANTTIHDRFKQELESLQSNETTYLTDPDLSNSSDKSNEFNEWKASFDSDSYKSVISNLLIENSSMRLLYSQLVPAKISNVDFWSRYFFKVNQLEEEHKKRVKLLERASKEDENLKKEDSEQDWGDDEDNVKLNDDKNLANDSNEENIDFNETLKDEKNLEEKCEPNELNLNENKTENEIESTIADKINEPSIDSNEKLPAKSSVDKLETSQKTEDSDEWEKVFDSETEKKKVVNESSDECDLDTQSKNDKTIEENKEAVLNKKTKKQNEQAGDDWDNWDE